MVRAADGWLAVSLPRQDDRELVPAWLEVGTDEGEEWTVVESTVPSKSADELIERGRLLGLPVARLGEVSARPVAGGELGLPIAVHAVAGAAGPPWRPMRRLRVVDLSALWAGPLCTNLLALAGAEVIKVESLRRPDGTRRGSPAFFDLLNAGKLSVALDLSRTDDVEVLQRLIGTADVVVEASRPRALEQLGVDSGEFMALDGARVWVSITGYGRGAGGRDRVAFGDDAAVAGGLVAWDGDEPCFLADAVADPAAGITAAAACLAALAHGGHWLIDVSMARVAAELAGTGPAGTETTASADDHGVVTTADGSVPVAPPRARPPSGRGPRLGEHNEAVLAGRARRARA